MFRNDFVQDTDDNLPCENKAETHSLPHHYYLTSLSAPYPSPLLSCCISQLSKYIGELINQSMEHVPKIRGCPYNNESSNIYV